MMFTLPNIIAVAVILIVVGAAAFYIIRAKKRGQRCIGCPDGKRCSGCSGSCSSCSCCSSSTKEADTAPKG